MAITISWSSQITVRNSIERYKVGVWYIDGVEAGTCEIPLDSDANPIISEEAMIAQLEEHNT